MNKKIIQARDNIIEAAGRTTQGFGLGRIIGQLYALLYFSPEAMSLDEMAEALKVSKGSVSTNIRELEKWGAARRIWVKGDRKDYYEAEVDLLRVLKDGGLPLFARKLNSSLTAVAESRDLLSSGKQAGYEDGKLAEFYSRRLDLIEQAQGRLSALLKLSGL